MVVYMKKVKVYFKSGNTLSIRCEKFEFYYDNNNNNRNIRIIKPNKVEWMMDASQIEAYTIKNCLFYWV